MATQSGDVWAAATGLGAAAFGAVATLFEPGVQPPGTPAPEVARFVRDNAGRLEIQALLFGISSALFLWFAAHLFRRLSGAHGAHGVLPVVVLAGAVASSTLTLLALSAQTAVAKAAEVGLGPSPLILGNEVAFAVFGLAALPTAGMLVAFALATFRTHAFPRWLAWVALVGAVAYLALSLQVVIDTGLFAPDSVVTFLPYPFHMLWLTGTSLVMLLRPATPVLLTTP